MRPVSFNAGLFNPYNHLSSQKANPGISFGAVADPRDPKGSDPEVVFAEGKANGKKVSRNLLNYALEKIKALLRTPNGAEAFHHLAKAYNQTHEVPPLHMVELVKLGLLTNKPPIKDHTFPKNNFLGLATIMEACSKDEKGTFIFVEPTIKK